MINYMFRPVLVIFRLSQGNLRSYYKHSCACGVEISTYGPYQQKLKQESNKNNTKQKEIQKNKAIVGVCSAGMAFCSRAEACSSSFSLIMLRCRGLGYEIPLPMLRVLVCSRSFRFYPLVGASPCGWRRLLLCCHVLFSCVQLVPSLCSLLGVVILLIGSCCLLCVAGSFTVLQTFTARHLVYY